MKILLVIIHAKTAQQAVPWLVKSARIRDAELYIANCALNPVSVPGRASAWPLIEKPENIRDAVEAEIEKVTDSNVTLTD